MKNCLKCKKPVKEKWAQGRGLPPIHRDCFRSLNEAELLIVNAAKRAAQGTGPGAGKIHAAKLIEGLGLVGKEG